MGKINVKRCCSTSVSASFLQSITRPGKHVKILHTYSAIARVLMHILQFWSEMAFLQPTFATKVIIPHFPNKPSPWWKCKTFPSSAESCCLIGEIYTLKATENTPCKLSRCFSMALLCFQVSSPALDLCQCHSNVSGCVIVLSRQHFSEESVIRAPCLCRTGGECLFLDSPTLIVFWVI